MHSTVAPKSMPFLNSDASVLKNNQSSLTTITSHSSSTIVLPPFVISGMNENDHQLQAAWLGVDTNNR
jgi:hypothetical protein